MVAGLNAVKRWPLAEPPGMVFHVLPANIFAANAGSSYGSTIGPVV